MQINVISNLRTMRKDIIDTCCCTPKRMNENFPEWGMKKVSLVALT